MLLKIALTGLFVLGASSFAEAKIDHLTPGRYVLKKGDKNFCPNFDIPKSMPLEDAVRLGDLYTFQATESSDRVDSDLDPNCVFTTENRRIDSSNKTILEQKNAELCKGKVKSETMMSLTIEPTQISLLIREMGHKDDVCIFQKRDKK